jgi:succinate-semialdehyde dehydrogenase / glutarate-semialdehyde dehydrogenase
MADTASSPATVSELSTPRPAAIEDGYLISTHPATGVEVSRHRVTPPEELPAVLERAREAGRWWASLGFAERRRRLLTWRSRLANQMPRIVDVLHAEAGKPTADGSIEAMATVISMDWAARNAQRVLGPRRVRRVLASPESAGRLEYQPYGVVGVIGPWNFPLFTPMSSIMFALAAGNAVIHKPSEYTPGVGQWLADSLLEVVGEHPLLQMVHGDGTVGEALCRSGVDKMSFAGSTGTAKKVMAACAPTLTPLVIEGAGKDAFIVDDDADLDRAADSCLWGALNNAGQACVSLERIYVVDSAYEGFVQRLTTRIEKLTVGGRDGHIGPIITPMQIEVIRRHIEDAVDRGARALIGGKDAVRPPYVHPTLLVDVPRDALTMHEETFGPVVAVTRVGDVEEALRLANDNPYGLGGAVFGRRNAIGVARRMRAGMVSVNDVFAYAGAPGLPWGGVGASGFGRLRGDDGLREFAQAKAVSVRQAPELFRARSFARGPNDIARAVRIIRRMFGRAPR